MVTDFSFQQDIAPFASSYFKQATTNPFLSAAQRTRLSSTALDELEKLREANMKRDAVTLDMELGRSRLDRERLALEEARMQLDNLRDATREAPAASAEFESILGDPVATEKEKRARIASLGMKYAKAITHSPELATRFRFAANSVASTEGLTPYQQLSLMQREQGYARADAKESRAEQLRANREWERNELDRFDKVLSSPVEADELDPTKPPAFKDKAARLRAEAVLRDYAPDVAANMPASDLDLMRTLTEVRARAFSPNKSGSASEKARKLFETGP